MKMGQWIQLSLFAQNNGVVHKVQKKNIFISMGLDSGLM